MSDLLTPTIERVDALEKRVAALEHGSEGQKRPPVAPAGEHDQKHPPEKGKA